jgi:hypothetical protein
MSSTGHPLVMQTDLMLRASAIFYIGYGHTQIVSLLLGTCRFFPSFNDVSLTGTKGRLYGPHLPRCGAAFWEERLIEFAVVLPAMESCEERDSRGNRPCGVTPAWPLSFVAERKRPQIITSGAVNLGRFYSRSLGARIPEAVNDSWQPLLFH